MASTAGTALLREDDQWQCGGGRALAGVAPVERALTVNRDSGDGRLAFNGIDPVGWVDLDLLSASGRSRPGACSGP